MNINTKWKHKDYTHPHNHSSHVLVPNLQNFHFQIDEQVRDRPNYDTSKPSA